MPSKLDSKRRAKIKKRWFELSNGESIPCFYCRLPLTRETVTIDHKIARAYDGPHSMWNLFPACSDCNGAKKDMNMTPAELLRERERLLKNKYLGEIERLTRRCNFLEAQQKKQWRDICILRDALAKRPWLNRLLFKWETWTRARREAK